MSSKQSTKALQQKRRHRRQWLTFWRMVRYGTNNFTRNAWLTIAATAVMTITLLIVLITVAAQNVLIDTTIDVGKRIDRSIFLVTGTTYEQAAPIIEKIAQLPNVDSVSFVSSEEARAQFAEENKDDLDALDALREATNMLPATIKVVLDKSNDTESMVNYINSSETLRPYLHPDRESTFLSERKNAADTIAAWTDIAQRVGIVASVVFVSISMLIVFNTIRMAIFNRKEEIQMMKLVGADKQFIRGPFVVEAIVYGLISAVIATGIGVVLLFTVDDQLTSWGVAVEPTIRYMTQYGVFVLMGMVLVGALIGTISSLLATRRYLRL